MTGKVPRGAPHQCALNAAFGIGRQRQAGESKRYRRASEHLHQSLPGMRPDLSRADVLRGSSHKIMTLRLLSDDSCTKLLTSRRAILDLERQINDESCHRSQRYPSRSGRMEMQVEFGSAAWFRLGPAQIAIHQGQTVLVTELDGQMDWPKAVAGRF
jgi:hypothetical protein